MLLQENFKELRDVAPKAKSDDLTKILSFGTAILNTDSSKTQLPEFPSENLKQLAHILNNNPTTSIHDLIYRLYPYRLLSSTESHANILTMMDGLKIKVDDRKQRIAGIVDTGNGEGLKSVTLESGGILKKSVTFNVPGGHVRSNDQIEKFIATEYQTAVLADLVQSHGVGDYCLVGPKGSGKSAIVFELSRLLDQTFEPMVLYQDMTARDLIQQRTTKPNGDTIWRDSPLVRAARLGNIAILDGIHRIHHSTISILHRLVHDREVQLYDGRRLIRHDKYDDLLASGSSVEELEAKGILRIHPAFRMVALAEPPTFDNAQTNWLTPEMLSLFMFHEIRNLSKAEEVEIMTKLYGAPSRDMNKIIDLSHFLREARDPILKNLSATLSTRQLLRIAHRMSQYECDSHEMIQRAFLSKFLPTLPRQALDGVLDRFEIRSTEISQKPVEIKKDLKNGQLTIGSTTTDVYKTMALTKVPDILFYDVPQHIRLLEHVLQDFLIGSHLLLVGNQGVGKNKIADRLLQLMNRPREYIQLHRDTTVQTLTLQPTVRDGVVVYEDSPLVRAVKLGHILVVDEADKAPTHVTCILKTLVENGEMNLSDGRKILSKFSAIPEDERFIKTHPDFRMIVLANRPGFPFLGNDFFASLGDLFSCHAVDNPSTESEIFLLQKYGPDVPHSTIRKLVIAFDELRTMADVGQLSYPYSTREVVNIIKHLQKFPAEDMVELIGNVLDFDRYTPEMLELVTAVLQKHGFAIEAYAKNELASIRRQKEIQLTVERVSGQNVSAPKHGKVDPKNDPHVGGNTWAGGTGGRDTAGLGGKGGPYRLDAGHKVHQLSDAEKDDIPDEVKKAAFEMNRKAFADKLKEIQMSAYDHKVYEEYSVPVRKQVQQLRVVLNSLQAKSKERHWQKHQTAGELDDAKLIEGIIGERNVYRKRADIDPEPGQPQEKPKRLKLVVDVSGSMYRFVYTFLFCPPAYIICVYLISQIQWI